MGYNTEFQGRLTFKQPLTDEQITKLEEILGEDFRDHLTWQHQQLRLTWCDLCWEDKNKEALIWDGSEKTYDLPQKVDQITRVMRRTWSDFQFVGGMDANGEEMGDHWGFEIDEDGWTQTYEAEVVRTDKRCPHCGGNIS